MIPKAPLECYIDGMALEGGNNKIKLQIVNFIEEMRVGISRHGRI